MTGAPYCAPLPHSHLPTQVLLERELAKLSAELDKDLREIKNRQPVPKVPALLLLPGRGALGPLYPACSPELTGR